jgi:hypothetical protein
MATNLNSCSSCSSSPFSLGDSILPQSVRAKVYGSAQYGSVDCCDFIQLLNNILSFVFYMAIPIVALMIAWGGIIMLTSSGNASRIKQGQGYIKSGLIGLLIVLGANIILRGIFMGLGADVGLLPWN